MVWLLECRALVAGLTVSLLAPACVLRPPLSATPLHPPPPPPPPLFHPPQQAADILSVLSTRLAVALFVSANAIALLGTARPATLLPLLVTLVTLLSPAPATAREFARSFRLGEALASATVNFSVLAGIPMVAMALVGAGAAGLLPGAGGGVAAAGECGVERCLCACFFGAESGGCNVALLGAVAWKISFCLF